MHPFSGEDTRAFLCKLFPKTFAFQASPETEGGQTCDKAGNKQDQRNCNLFSLLSN